MEAAALSALVLTETSSAASAQEADGEAFASLLADDAPDQAEVADRRVKITDTAELSPESILALLLAPLQPQPEPTAPEPPTAGAVEGAPPPGSAGAGDPGAPAAPAGSAFDALAAGQEGAFGPKDPIENGKPADGKTSARGQDGRAPASTDQPRAREPRVDPVQQRETGPGLESDAAAQPASAEPTIDAPTLDPALGQGVAGAHASGGRAESAAAPASVRAPMPVYVAQQIAHRFDGKSSTIEIQLEAPEIGRVEVRLDVDAQSRVHAAIAADHAATLRELVRHAREIERTLQSSGLDLAPDGLSFDLAERGGREDSQRTQQQPLAGRNANASADADAGEAPPPRPFGLETWSAARLDMWA